MSIFNLDSEAESSNYTVEQYLYFTDTLALLPYGSQDEPLWLLQQLDTTLSVIGNTAIMNFKNKCVDPDKKDQPQNSQTDEIQAKDILENSTEINNSEDLLDLDEPELNDEQAYKLLLKHLVDDNFALEQFHKKLMACFLLYALKSYLREAYNLTDDKVQEYQRVTSFGEAANFALADQLEKQHQDREGNGSPEPIPPEKRDPKKEKQAKKEAKMKKNEKIKGYDKPVNRKIGVYFNQQPSLQIVLEYLKNKLKVNYSSENCRLYLIHQYTMFRQLLEMIDTIIDDDLDHSNEMDEMEYQRMEQNQNKLNQERIIFGSLNFGGPKPPISSIAQHRDTLKVEDILETKPENSLSGTSGRPTTGGGRRSLMITNTSKGNNANSVVSSRRLLVSSKITIRDGGAKKKQVTGSTKRKHIEEEISEEESEDSYWWCSKEGINI